MKISYLKTEYGLKWYESLNCTGLEGGTWYTGYNRVV